MEAWSCDTAFRWVTEFYKGGNSLLDEELRGKSLSAVEPENVSAIQKMLILVYLPNN